MSSAFLVGIGVLHGISLAASLLTGTLFWLRRPQTLAVLCGTLLVLGAIAYDVRDLSVAIGIDAPVWRCILLCLGMSAPLWFWACVHILFEDMRRLPDQIWLCLVPLLLAGIATGLLPREDSWRAVLQLAGRLTAATLLLQAGWQVLHGRKTDLDDARIVLRRRLAVLLCAGAAFLVAGKLLLPLLTSTRLSGLPEVAILAAIKLAAAFLLLSPNQALFAPPAPPHPAAFAPTPETDRLLNMMRKEQPWKDPDLTVAALAARLGLAEYRLRRQILQTLGYRNFATFLNAYRLAAAAQALRDPAQSAQPILSIALDHGFGSIGPFNRAFKAQYGQTPSTYRKAPPAPG